MASRRIRAAVLAVHWQVNMVRPEGFFGPMLGDPVARSGVVARASAFHRAAREREVPVVFTRFIVPIGEGELVRNTGIMRSIGAAQTEFRPNAPGSQLIPEMTGQAREIFDTQKLSALAGSRLPGWLTERGIGTLFLTGVATNLAVEQTARHATDLGFQVHPVADCVTAMTPEAHRTSLANLELVTAGCRTAAAVLELIRGTRTG
ncbi:cysteine hydrolase [Nocardia panacis]|uniref:Cysteine hydrolase n=1 Tax=Nocardia panacis TaxID=2340916 RepID=A0A3A4L3K0_9NOCA|nr:cysteine hydrolase [Nocardia panacis]RJO76913.1 cysteine hydrolase [Nocardia panacis]